MYKRRHTSIPPNHGRDSLNIHPRFDFLVADLHDHFDALVVVSFVIVAALQSIYFEQDTIDNRAPFRHHYRRRSTGFAPRRMRDFLVSPEHFHQASISKEFHRLHHMTMYEPSSRSKSSLTFFSRARKAFTISTCDTPSA